MPSGVEEEPVRSAATCECGVRWCVDIESHDVVRVPPRGDDVLNTGKVGSSEDLSISDEVVPAYPKNRTLASYVGSLELP